MYAIYVSQFTNTAQSWNTDDTTMVLNEGGGRMSHQVSHSHDSEVCVSGNNK